MAARRVDGTALLVAGVGLPSVAALDASAVHTLGQIGEALLATGVPWQIRRLTATAGERYAADRATLKRHVDELVAEPARVAIVVLLGSIVQTKAGPALVTGAQPLEYPDDATLPLAWIRDRLLVAKAEELVVVLSAIGDGVPRGWLDALGTDKKTHVVAIEKSADDIKHPTVDALLTGLCGDALDPRTGTVTMASLSDHLAKVAAVELQLSTASETIAQPPPLAGLWDVRRSQLANRAPRTQPTADDLTGSVLPGRFRLDRLVARGTFGTVYRARQLAVERDIAVKVLHADIDPSSEDGRLFVHEIRSVGRIDHDNVVRIHQADITHDGRLFFAMELLDGEDLQSLGGKGALPREQVIELGRQLLEGLGAAHDAGLVHADVKPANAILVPETRSKSGRHHKPPAHDRLVLVDFGLSRLRAPDKPTASAGGTPAYMAPEQLHEGRVDARSDLFSAALVLVYLLTGWRRPNAFMLVPPLETIADEHLRTVLARALERDPAKRFQSAREFAAALTGGEAPAESTGSEPPRGLPFRHLAPLTEADRDRLHGRESDLAVIAEAVLFRRSVIYTAPSGTGKTSLLRAGLLPRLEALGVRAIYLRCRTDSTEMLANEIAPGATSIEAAIAAWHEQGGGKLVLVLDQLEAALGDPAFLASVLAFDRFGAADVSVVLSVREDYLARLVARTQILEPNIPIVRLPPLAPAGARAAIVHPLTEARLAIEPDLLDILLDDLVRAAAAIGPEMGWGNARAVYPPHLQLACSVLYEALGSGEATITLAHYRKLGGFDAIVGEHLDRVLDTELADGRDVIARDLFVALVTTAHERAVRTESELLAMVSAHPRDRVLGVLELLRSRGLLVRVRGDGEPSWELIHDSLVKRVLAWVDRRDLARRRAIELVRYHLRRSRPDAPSLLGRAELRELRPHAGAISELDDEWKKRNPDADDWTPARLVARSHAVLRRRTLTFSSIIFGALAIATVGFYRSHVQSERARREESLRVRDLGRFTLELELFDWDPQTLQPIVRAATPDLPLDWTLHAPSRADMYQPGTAYDDEMLVRGTRVVQNGLVVENVEAHGGPAFLVIQRRGCAPSTVPLSELPGYAQRDTPSVIRIRVPTCEASAADMIEIPEGEFLFGGLGEPPSEMTRANWTEEYAERVERLPTFRIDRTEVTNAAFSVFASMSRHTNIRAPQYPDTREIKNAGAPAKPVAGIDWIEARAYCQFLGKQLPTSAQWTRVLRGPIRTSDGDNSHPRRNFPWGNATSVAPAKLPGVGEPGAGAVASYPLDRSPEGVFDLAGNVMEWTSSVADAASEMRIVRGGCWGEFSTLSALPDFMTLENPRPQRQRQFDLGMRCVSSR